MMVSHQFVCLHSLWVKADKFGQMLFPAQLYILPAVWLPAVLVNAISKLAISILMGRTMAVMMMILV